MGNNGVGSTALGAAVCRLIEQYQPKRTRLFDDPVVRHLVGMPIGFMMQFALMRNFTIRRTDAVAKGIYGEQVCRTRFIDDVVRSALSLGIPQLVILGAGFDTRPYRLQEAYQANVFEIDLPEVQELKKKRIQRLLGQLPPNVTFGPIDFDKQSVDSVLADTSFTPSNPALFVWEGVTQYLSEEAVRRTLSFVGTSARGSSIVFTYVLKSIIERRSDIQGANKLMDVVSKRSPWTFGLEQSAVQEYLRQFHLDLVVDVGKADYREKYLQSIRRDLAIFEGERTVRAAVERP